MLTHTLLLTILVLPTLAHANTPTALGVNTVPGANPTPQPSVKVSLFGSPCILKGNFSIPALSATHQISPERIQDPQTLEQAKRALDQTRKIKDLPKELELYRDKLARRLNALIKFFGLLPQVTKNKNFDALLEGLKGLIPPSRLTEFKLSGRKYLGAGGNPVNPEALTELFKNSIDPYPEENFHRMIDQLGIRYQCTFEEAGAEDPIED